VDKQSARIIIADDHAVVRTGLQLILEETTDLSIEDEARDGQELLEKLTARHFDLVILDISMPGRDSLEVLLEIRSGWKDLPVVIFSMNSDEVYAIRMLKNGASAYINKETKPKQIIEIIRTVLRGRKYFSDRHMEIMTEMVTGPGKSDTAPHQALTDREFQIFLLLVSGTKKPEIAEKLLISKHTLSNHRNNIMKKMNISTNAELIRYAFQNGIIQ
jgi:two-component system, NarL family, invasion response regulator UvrY